MERAELATRLEAFLARVTNGAVAVRDLRRLPGGASRETWSFDAVFDGAAAARPLVLRLDPGPTSMESDRAREFGVLRAAHLAGIPVPEVLWLGDETISLGARFLIMTRLDGETLGRRLLRDEAYAGARRLIGPQLGAILARIHAVDVTSADVARLPGPAPDRSPGVTQLDQYETLYRTVAPEAHPVIELALRWLRTRLPATPRLALVHGDYRIGNVMFGPEGVRAILDWELAHRGDPVEDLGWLCVKAWRFGGARPVGGVAERAELLAAYEQAGGERVRPERLHYWEVFGNLKWAVICIGQARTYLDGTVPSLELAAIGRRTAEVEHDLLELVA